MLAEPTERRVDSQSSKTCREEDDWKKQEGIAFFLDAIRDLTSAERL